MMTDIAGVAVMYLDSNKKIVFPTSGVTSGQYLSVELDNEVSCDNTPPGAVGSIYDSSLAPSVLINDRLWSGLRNDKDLSTLHIILAYAPMIIRVHGMDLSFPLPLHL
jgi:hypothetical protein